MSEDASNEITSVKGIILRTGISAEGTIPLQILKGAYIS
jgi:hypothetical protein